MQNALESTQPEGLSEFTASELVVESSDVPGAFNPFSISVYSSPPQEYVSNNPMDINKV
ncbi:MAG: hypothetical protein IPO32_10765 [Crocinitomicaceae bacterium]|nr:hypothetical protein [Crocinitomicaceae bacterium]